MNISLDTDKVYDPKFIISQSQISTLEMGLKCPRKRCNSNIHISAVNDRWASNTPKMGEGGTRSLSILQGMFIYIILLVYVRNMQKYSHICDFMIFQTSE